MFIKFGDNWMRGEQANRKTRTRGGSDVRVPFSIVIARPNNININKPECWSPGQTPSGERNVPARVCLTRLGTVRTKPASSLPLNPARKDTCLSFVLLFVAR